MKSKHKAQKVAKWMLEELKRQHKLHQDTLVYEIAQKFGSQFTCDNENGNLAIRRDVLAAFRELTLCCLDPRGPLLANAHARRLAGPTPGLNSDEQRNLRASI